MPEASRPALHRLAPPRAPKRPTTRSRHGETVVDDYAWLKTPDWRAAMLDPSLLPADIRAYLEAENAYAAACLEPLAGLQERLFAEMKARIKEDDSTVPARDGPYLYYQRYETGGQHPIYCRRRDHEDAPEEVLLDGPRAAEGLPFFRIVACRHAPDHRLLAFAADSTGSESCTIRFRDLAGGETLPDAIEGAHGDIAWAADRRTLFYTVLDERHRPSRVYRHRLGEDAADDALVYEEPDPGFYVGLATTEDRRFIVVEARDHAPTTEVRLIDAARPGEPPLLVARREPELAYDVSAHGETLVIRTNADSAEDFKVVLAPLSTPGHAAWRDLVPHRPGRLIRQLRLFRDFLVRLERADGRPRIVVRELATGAEHEIAFEEETFDLGIVAGFEFATDRLRFTYSSLATPERTYDYDMRSRARVLRKEQAVPSGHDPESYVTRRVFARGHDGAEIPVSLFHRRRLVRDGPAPLLLYGYGAYGFAMPASFQPNRLSLVDRGFVYAIAHVRGGTDKGYRWYRDGKLGKKSNTFLDFIAAAEHLIGEGYTSAGRIVAQGRSAGGLLVGAVANLRPDLFKAVLAEVPFVDVLNTMCDPQLPLTPPEWTEWGNPVEDAAAYRYIRSYSPYDNVARHPYPNVLATAGISDPRVTYWEPAKWVARLRELKTDDNLVLLETNMEAGHAGAGGRLDRLEEVARSYAFVLGVFGIEG
ncbi:MAG: S9 family peptidase [Proteobacteria bacterium]|nr:S9 family peptidase [Pseudomonadota bacterium]